MLSEPKSSSLHSTRFEALSGVGRYAADRVPERVVLLLLDLGTIGANLETAGPKERRVGPDCDVLSARAFGAALTKHQGSKASSALNDDILTIAMPGFSSRCCKRGR